MSNVQEFFREDPFVNLCGLELLECRPGYAKAQVKIDDRHFNKLGVAHGGLIFTLADYCFGTAANADGKLALTISSTIYYFHKVTEGVLTAVAKEVEKSNRLHTYEVSIFHNDELLIAKFIGMVYATKQELNFES